MPFPATYASSSTQLQGVIGGVHIGYNWQVSQFVFGLEGRADGTSLSKSTQPLGSILSYNVKTRVAHSGACCSGASATPSTVRFFT